MKKLVLSVIVVFCVFALLSCEKTSNVCYYGYFSDEVIAIVYSEKKNILYEVKIPLDKLILWIKSIGTDNMNLAVSSFTGIKEDGFMVGDNQVLSALRAVLNALAAKGQDNSIESRMEVLTTRDDILNNSQLLEKLNKLCSTDFSKLAKVLRGKKAQVCYIDASEFLTDTDIVKTQEFFQIWMSQVLGL